MPKLVKELLVMSLMALMVVLIFGVVWMQYKYEDYITEQVEHFGILRNRPRLANTPAVWHYFQREVLEIDTVHAKASLLLYPEELINKTARIPQIDKYIVECYYSRAEVDSFLIARAKEAEEAERRKKAFEECPLAAQMKNALSDFATTDLIEKKLWLLEQFEMMYFESKDILDSKCSFMWQEKWYGEEPLVNLVRQVKSLHGSEKEFNGYKYLVDNRFAFTGDSVVVGEVDKALATMSIISSKKFMQMLTDAGSKPERELLLKHPDWSAIDTKILLKAIEKFKYKDEVKASIES